MSGLVGNPEDQFSHNEAQIYQQQWKKIRSQKYEKIDHLNPSTLDIYLFLQGDKRLVSLSLSKDTDSTLVEAAGVCSSPAIPRLLRLSVLLGVMCSNLATSWDPEDLPTIHVQHIFIMLV